MFDGQLISVMLSTEFKQELKHDVACCTRDGTAQTLGEDDSKSEETCKNMSKLLFPAASELRFSFISLTKNNQLWFVVN